VKARSIACGYLKTLQIYRQLLWWLARSSGWRNTTDEARLVKREKEEQETRLLMREKEEQGSLRQAGERRKLERQTRRTQLGRELLCVRLFGREQRRCFSVWI
jgi:hypothetical protein